MANTACSDFINDSEFFRFNINTSNVWVFEFLPFFSIKQQ